MCNTISMLLGRRKKKPKRKRRKIGFGRCFEGAPCDVITHAGDVYDKRVEPKKKKKKRLFLLFFFRLLRLELFGMQKAGGNEVEYLSFLFFLFRELGSFSFAFCFDE